MVILFRKTLIFFQLLEIYSPFMYFFWKYYVFFLKVCHSTEAYFICFGFNYKVDRIPTNMLNSPLSISDNGVQVILIYNLLKKNILDRTT